MLAHVGASSWDLYKSNEPILSFPWVGNTVLTLATYVPLVTSPQSAPPFCKSE